MESSYRPLFLSCALYSSGVDRCLLWFFLKCLTLSVNSKSVSSWPLLPNHQYPAVGTCRQLHQVHLQRAEGGARSITLFLSRVESGVSHYNGHSFHVESLMIATTNIIGRHTTLWCSCMVGSCELAVKPWSHRPTRLNSTKIVCWVESGRAMWSRLYGQENEGGWRQRCERHLLDGRRTLHWPRRLIVA